MAPTNEKIKNLIELENNPTRAILRLMEDMKRDNKLQIDAAIEELKERAQSEDIFGDIEPAKKAGETAAKKEIQEFKTDTNEKIQSVVKQVKETKEETQSKLELLIEKALTSFKKSMVSLMEIATKDIAGMEATLDAKLSKIISKIEKMRGPKGKDGKDALGKQGLPGKEGKEGKEGSPDTPKQVKNKLETLKGEKRLDKSAIKGLDEFMNNVSQRITRIRQGRGGSGGGMGNLEHETFAISSATTSITLARKIAAGGTAIIDSVYENANLERTNHYTVGGDRRTITFSTDIQAQFEDDTVASFTYVRA